MYNVKLYNFSGVCCLPFGSFFSLHTDSHKELMWLFLNIACLSGPPWYVEG